MELPSMYSNKLTSSNHVMDTTTGTHLVTWPGTHESTTFFDDYAWPKQRRLVIDDDKKAKQLKQIRDTFLVKPNEKEGKKMVETKPKRRIVQVFIADPDENVPLKDALIYQGPQGLTDSTDQELFFEVSINDILQKHNALRATLLNKKATEKAGKDIFLEPIRIRDLVMTVVEVASF